MLVLHKYMRQPSAFPLVHGHGTMCQLDDVTSSIFCQRLKTHLFAKCFF